MWMDGASRTMWCHVESAASSGGSGGGSDVRLHGDRRVGVGRRVAPRDRLHETARQAIQHATASIGRGSGGCVRRVGAMAGEAAVGRVGELLPQLARVHHVEVLLAETRCLHLEQQPLVVGVAETRVATFELQQARSALAELQTGRGRHGVFGSQLLEHGAHTRIALFDDWIVFGTA